MLNLSRHRWLRCTLCILLAVVVAFMPTVRGVVLARAEVLTVTAIVYIGATILTALGITFANPDAVQRAALSLYAALEGAAKVAFDAAVAAYQFAETAAPYLLNLTGTMMQLFATTAWTLFKPTATTAPDNSWQTGALPADTWRGYVGQTLSTFNNNSKVGDKYVCLPIPIVLNQPFDLSRLSSQFVVETMNLKKPLLNDFTWRDTSGWTDYSYNTSSSSFLTDNVNEVYRFFNAAGDTIDIQIRLSLLNAANTSRLFFVEILQSINGGAFTVSSDTIQSRPSAGFWKYRYSPYEIGAYFNFDSSGTLNPSFYVNAIDSSGAVSTIDNINGTIRGSVSGSCVLGLPLDRVTGQSVCPDIAYTPDKVLSNPDVFNKSLDDAITLNPDISIGLEVPVADTKNPAIPDVLGKTWDTVWTESRLKDAIKDAIKESTANPPDPGGGGGGDSGGGTFPPPAFVPVDMLFKAFPFCIPLDLAAILGALVADPIAPRFVIPFKVGDIIDNEIVLDLTKWESVVKIIREGEYILFLIGMAMLTFTARKV